MKKAIAISLISALVSAALAGASGNNGTTSSRLEIPFGKAIVVDGILSPEEWHDAASAEIEVEPGWTVRVLYKHDAANLYFAFNNLKHGKSKRYAEVLIDARNRKSNFWQSGQWWFHTSYNLCEGNGAYNVYYRNGVFQCSQTKPGWAANRFPLGPGEAIEFQFSFSKLDLDAKPGAVFGIAFDVTDTKSRWNLWPAAAKLEQPSTWGDASIEADLR